MFIFSGTAEPRAAPAAARRDGGVSVPLYLSGLVVLLCGITTVCYELESDSFTLFTVLTAIAGVICSYLLRRRGVSSQWITIGAIGAGVVFLYTLRQSGLAAGLVPAGALQGPDTRFAAALALTAALSAFLLLSDEAVLFTGVFSIAMIGLIGTSNVNNELLACFLVFLAAIVFLIVHQNGLQQTRQAGGAPPPFPPARLLRTQALLALICTGTAILLGFLLSFPVRFALRGLALTGALRALRVPPGLAAMSGSGSMPGTLAFDDPWRFDVGLGPVDDDQTLLLTVELVNGGEPPYWRGRTFGIYTGHGWDSGWGMASRRQIGPEDGGGGEAGAFPGGGGIFRFQNRATPHLFRLTSDDPREESVPRKQTRRYLHRFRLLTGDASPLFAAAEPRLLRARANSVYRRPDNTFGVPLDYSGSLEEYEVESDVSEASPRDLMRSGDSYPRNIVRRYGRDDRSPNRGLITFNPDLAELAVEATQGARDPYSKAEAIRSFVAERCVYTLDAPAVPRDQDTAQYFLNVTKTGYCDLYATAVAVLCRYAGLPARIATGFIPGRPSPAAPNVYELRAADRHAWAEVYFAGYGWIPFDATVGTTVMDQETAERSSGSSLLALLRRFWEDKPAPFVLGALGLLALFFVLVRETWDRLRGRRTRVADPAERVNAVVAAYLGVVRAVTRRGRVARPSSMTPAAYVGAVQVALGDAVAEPLARLTALAEQALYGPEAVTDQHVLLAGEAARDVRAGLKQARASRKGEKTDGRQAAPAS